MRVALVSDCYLPRLGGIEVQVHTLAEQLQQRGHQVRVVTATRPAPSPPAGMPSAHRVQRLLPPLPLPAPVNPWAGPELREMVREVDVVHVHLGVVGPFAATAATVAVRAGVPTVVTWHSLPGRGLLARLAARRWRRWVRAGAVPTAVSGEAAAQVGRLLGSDGVGVLPDGLDAGGWRSPDDPGPRPGRPRLVAAMRFSLRKRPLQVIVLVARVRRALPPERRPELEIAGEGPWRGPLGALARHTPWGAWLHLPGRLTRAELAERYRDADLYLAPSRKEAFGIAALEARAAGLPVVGYAGTGVGDIVTDELSGFLATGDGDLVRRLQALLADPERLTRMRAHLRSAPTTHDWAHVLARTERAYARAGAPA